MEPEPPGAPSIHRVDAADRLSFVNETWRAFARGNAGSGLEPEAVIGRPLWQFIAGREVAYLFRAVLQEVRERARAVTLPFRCDAPAVRRDMELEVVPLAAGAVEFRSHLKAQVERPPVALLEAAVARTSWHLPICSWCKSVEAAPGRWVDTETAVRTLGLLAREAVPRLRHTICPRCEAAVRGGAGLGPGEPAS